MQKPFHHKRRADNGLVATDANAERRAFARFLAAAKQAVEAGPRQMFGQAGSFGMAIPGEALGLVQRALFKHTLVTPRLVELLSSGGPTSLPAAYKFYAENLVRPTRMVAYMRGTEGSFRGHLRIERGEDGLRMLPHADDLRPSDDRMVEFAVGEDRICYITRTGIRSIGRHDLKGRILLEPGYFDGDSRMVIPFDKNLGLLDIEGPDITFGNLVMADTAALTTGLMLSRLVSMKMVSELDMLTGLFTRRAYEDLMSFFADVHIETGQDMSLLMFDLDHFKRVNDTYGHMAGDDVLARAASVAVTSLRTSDVVARAADGDSLANGERLVRYGGEEFVVLLPGANPEGAAIAANRYRNAMRSLEVRAPSGEDIKVTVSIGIASFSDARRVIENDMHIPKVNGTFTGSGFKGALMCCVKTLADAALYRAKEDGRDQVVKVVTEGVGKGVDFQRCG